MKNGLDNADGDVQPPPAKRIKLEEDSSEEGRLLSQKRRGKGRKKLSKSTMEERALILLNDDRIGAVEPQQVLCRMCGNWVKLFKHIDYSPANWRTHADKCESRSRWRSRIQEDPGLVFSLTVPASVNPSRTSLGAESVSIPPVATSNSLENAASQSNKVDSNDFPSKDSKEQLVSVASFSTRRPLKSTAQRRFEIKNDPRCEDNGPHSVFCKMCGQVVRLHNTREYDLWNWHRHAEKCEVKTSWSDSEATAPHNPTMNTEISAMNEGTLTEVSSLGDQSGSAEPINVSRILNLPVAQPAFSIENAQSTSSGSEVTISSARIHTPDRQKGRTNGKIFSMRGQKVRNTPRHPTPIILECLDEQHPVGEGSVEGMHRNPARSDSKVQPTVYGLAAPFIKAELDDNNETLHPVPESKANEGGTSASIPASTKRRKGRTAEERRQALLNDPRVGQVLPNEVFCKMCSKWIKLYKEVDYVESNWIRHAERCGIRLASKNAFQVVLPTPPAAIVSAPNSAPTQHSPVKSDEERLRDLQADPRIKAIEPHQVLCDICKQWIKLQSYREYDIWNWQKHVPLCEQRHSSTNESTSIISSTQHHDPQQSSPNLKTEEFEDGPQTSVIAGPLTAPKRFSSPEKAKDESTAENRRAILEHDGRCENIEPQRVTCKLCNRVIGLHVKKDYSLSNWYKHVASCDKKTHRPARPAVKTPLPTIGVTLRSAGSANSHASSLSHPARTEHVKENNVNSSLELAGDGNGDVSAHSHVTKVAKSTPEERRVKLLADPRVDVVEPGRIKCKLCQHWLKLNEFMSYAPYNWYKHVERCEVRTSMKNEGTSQAPFLVKEEEPEVPEAQVSQEVKVSEEPSISTDSGARKRTTAAERLARMQADPRIKTIEKHRARCGVCDKWVKLQNKTEYDPHNWFAHIKKCALKSNAPQNNQPNNSIPAVVQEVKPSVPVESDLVACAVEQANNSTVLNRRALLLDDPRSAAVEPQRVLCGICQQWIKLREGKDYVPYNWFKHKRKCERRHGLSQTTALPCENVAPVHVPVKEIVKKEPLSSDSGLRDSDQRKLTDAEREAQLRADPRVGDVEPGRVFCKMCKSWIKLNMATGFLRGNWLRHAQRCNERTRWQGATPEGTEEPPELSAAEVIDLETTGSQFGCIELGRLIGKFEPVISSIEYGISSEAKATPEAVKQPQPRTWNMPTLRARPSTSRVNSPAPVLHAQSDSKMAESGKRMHRSEEERKIELESDPRTKIVLPDKILCKMCDHWIQMRRDVSYSPQNWLKHAGICEQKSGWLKENKSLDPDDTRHVQSVMEEFIPYNARVRAVREELDFDPPSLKPVDWGQVVPSDDEDDEIMTRGTVTKSAAPGEKTRPDSALGGRLQLAKIDSEKSNMDGTSANVVATKRSAPPSLAGPPANNGDLKPGQTVASAKISTSKPTSSSPPVVSPYSSIPMQFYRAAYPTHVVQHGFQAHKDGTPPESVSPQNGSAQRTLPFVVPGPSMLPHLLPRPVLVPISHTSRYATGPTSPFRLPATPPVPPIGLSKVNRDGRSPPSTSPVNMPTTSGGSRSIAAIGNFDDSTITPFERAEATDIAVPTPVRSLAEQNTIIAPVEHDQAQSVAASQMKPPVARIYQKSDLRPRDSGGVLQLHPVTDKLSVENLAERDDVTTAGRTCSRALRFVPVSDAEKSRPAAKEKVNATISPDGVLQLGPKVDMRAELRTSTDKRETTMQRVSNVLQLGHRTHQMAVGQTQGVAANSDPCALRGGIDPKEEEAATTLEEAPSKDVVVSAEPIKDAASIEA